MVVPCIRTIPNLEIAHAEREEVVIAVARISSSGIAIGEQDNPLRNEGDCHRIGCTYGGLSKRSLKCWHEAFLDCDMLSWWPLSLALLAVYSLGLCPSPPTKLCIERDTRSADFWAVEVWPLAQ